MTETRYDGQGNKFSNSTDYYKFDPTKKIKGKPTNFTPKKKKRK